MLCSYFSISMLMMSEITIATEQGNHANWLKIFIPYSTSETTNACIQNLHGEIIKQVKLFEGNNAIDMSCIEEDTVDVKINTAFETILRKINIPHHEKP